MAVEQRPSGTDRRQFLRRSAATGAGVLAGASTLDLLIPKFAAAKSGGVTSGDVAIVGAAQIAEALAVTTYTNIINQSPFFKRLPEDDQGYLKAARQEEMSHYALEMSVTGKPSPFTTFYYPPKMFSDAQTTLDVLVTLEDAFIAAYLVGVRDFSTPALRVLAARIMGIESDHRTLARVLAGDVSTRTAARSRRSPASRGRPRRPIRPTTTDTSVRSNGRRSARRSRRSHRSPTKRPPVRPGSIPPSRISSGRSLRCYRTPWAHFTRSQADIEHSAAR